MKSLINENTNKKKTIALIALVLISAGMGLVLADEPVILNANTSDIFNATQEETFELYIIALDPDQDSPIDLSYALFEGNQKNFSVFRFEVVNDTASLINFTPRNEDVIINDTYAIYIIAEDNQTEIRTIKIQINVSNINDAPNITYYYPTNLTLLTQENETNTFVFNYTSSDPDSSYGDNVTPNWWLDGNLITENETYNYSTEFCDAGQHNVTLMVHDLENATDHIEWNITVTNANRVPTYNTSVAIQNYTWQEESNNTNLFNASDYFYDLDSVECPGSNQDNLTYGVTGNTNIEIILEDDTSNASFYVQDNWFGTEYVTFTANDGYDTSSSSEINLTVTNVNDAPVIWAITNTTAWEYAPYSYQISYSEYDIEVDSDADSITFLENISSVVSSFSIDSSTGLINFTPVDGDEGEYVVNITAIDSFGEYQTSMMNLTIYDNRRPGILPITNTTANENVAFEIIITGVDPDSDAITFTSDYDRFTRTAINSTSTNFSFVPDNDDVGDHYITFTVTDTHGATNVSEIFNLSVIDQNTPPVLDAIADQVIRYNKNFSLAITGSDADLDVVDFRDNSTLFNITVIINSSGIGLAYINFTTTTEDIGNYSINITINDSYGLEDSQIFNIEIVPNRMPVLDAIETPQNTTTYVYYEVNISASDPDEDSLIFSSNFTGFTYLQINSTSASFSYTFDKLETGLINISIGVSDPEGSEDNTSFILNITHINNMPEFIGGTENRTFVYGFQDSFLVQGYDADPDTLTFGTNSSVMNITSINSTAMNFTFHTELESIGNITLTINLTDSYEVVTEFLIFTIRANQPPTIDHYSPTEQDLSTAENSSIDFNQSTSDADNAYNQISYMWRLAKVNETIKNWCNEYNNIDESTCIENNRSIICEWDGTNNCLDNHSYFVYSTKATTANWTYAPNWTEAGNYTAWLFVYDIYSGNDSHYWNLSVNNLNRMPVFGLKEHNSYSDFSGGTFDNTTLHDDGRVSLDMTEGIYFSAGTYLSNAINFQTDTYFNYTFINWSETTTPDTSTTLKTRTSVISNGAWSEYSTPYTTSGSPIVAEEKQYLQYMMIFNTNDTSVGVNATEAAISYDIADISISGPVFWIDLGTFFTDYDEDNALTYNVTGQESVIVDINNLTGAVTLTPSPNIFGIETIYFTASDGVSSVMSNEIIITIEEVEAVTPVVQPTSVSATTTTETKYEEKTSEKNISVPIAFELVVPGIVTIYENKTMTVPITIKNNENFTLTKISLSVFSQKDALDLELDETTFEILRPNEESQTMLNIKSNITKHAL